MDILCSHECQNCLFTIFVCVRHMSFLWGNFWVGNIHIMVELTLSARIFPFTRLELEILLKENKHVSLKLTTCWFLFTTLLITLEFVFYMRKETHNLWCTHLLCYSINNQKESIPWLLIIYLIKLRTLIFYVYDPKCEDLSIEIRS